MKASSEVCKTCKHYDERYDCKKVSIEYGKDGYGPWRGAPVCINDPCYKPTPNLYEPASHEDFSALRKQVQELEDQLYQANDKLGRVSSELARRIAMGGEDE